MQFPEVPIFHRLNVLFEVTTVIILNFEKKLVEDKKTEKQRVENERFFCTFDDCDKSYKHKPTLDAHLRGKFVLSKGVPKQFSKNGDFLE